MAGQYVEEPDDSLIDELAALEHERWAHWQQFLHSQGHRRSDGSLLLPADSVRRWDRQCKTLYRDLTNEEKESDRLQVRKYFPLLKRWLLTKRSQGE